MFENSLGLAIKTLRDIIDCLIDYKYYSQCYVLVLILVVYINKIIVV